MKRMQIKTFLRRGFSVLLILVLITGCEDKETLLNGSVVGFVKLLDENSYEILDRSNVTVKLNDKYSATTDASGKFEVKGVVAGTYIVTYEKEGFGTFKTFNFSFAGGGKPAVLYNVHLLKLPVFDLTQFHVFTQDNLVVQVTGAITESPGYNFTYYFSSKEEVTSTNFEFSYGYSFCCGSVTDFNHAVSLSGSPFKKGQKIYMNMYASNATNNFGEYNYYDHELGKTIDPALKEIIDPISVTLK